MKRFLIATVLSLATFAANAQPGPSNPGVIVNGAVTPGHCVKFGTSRNQIQDAGGVCGSSGVTTFNGRSGAVVPAANDYNFNQIAGSVACTQLPALTGEVTTSAGSCGTTVVRSTQFNWTSYHTFAQVPSFPFAASTFGVAIGFPLDAASHTIGANLQFNYLSIRQLSTGGFSQWTIGANSLVEGLTVFLESLSGSDATSVLYGMTPTTQNDGPGTVKTIHAANFATTGSTGVTITYSCGLTVVTTSSTGSVCADLVLVQNSGVADGVASLISLRSTGGLVLYGIGSSTIAPLPVQSAWADIWMATASAAGARAIRIRNNAGTEIAFWHKDGSLNATSLTLTSSPLAVASGGTGDTGTGWAAFTPTITCGAGTPTSYTTQVGRTKTIGKSVFLVVVIQINVAGTCSGTISVASLPFTVGSMPAYQIAARDGSTGQWLSANALAGTSTVLMQTAGGGNPTATDQIVLNGTLETN